MISRVDTCIQQIKKSVGNMNVLVSRREYLTFVLLVCKSELGI